VNISPGGITKRAVAQCAVGLSGLVDDAHNHEKHNTPERAVSLLDIEMLDALRHEGFDVGPGTAGENVTLEGVHVQRCVVGDHLRFSGGLEVALTSVRKPCYVLDAIDPTLKIAAVGRLGMLARVVRPAALRPGETVEVVRAMNSAIARNDVVGVLLAGGQSRRMGQDKARLPMPDGRTMAEVVDAALAELCGTVIVAGPASILPHRAHVRDGFHDAGPLAGIEAALRCGEASHVLVAPCDLPLVTSALLARLLVATDATMTIFEGEPPRSLPARIGRAALPAIRSLLEQRDLAVKRLLDRVDVHRVAIPADEEILLTNVNTPAEFTAALRR
jgi:molybdopterin-guanine dinucleotide biosynthesis protein A